MTAPKAGDVYRKTVDGVEHIVEIMSTASKKFVWYRFDGRREQYVEIDEFAVWVDGWTLDAPQAEPIALAVGPDGTPMSEPKVKTWHCYNCDADWSFRLPNCLGCGAVEKCIQKTSHPPQAAGEPCPRCDGDGKAHGSDRPFEWTGPDIYPGPCPVCKGSGKSTIHDSQSGGEGRTSPTTFRPETPVGSVQAEPHGGSPRSADCESSFKAQAAGEGADGEKCGACKGNGPVVAHLHLLPLCQSCVDVMEELATKDAAIDRLTKERDAAAKAVDDNWITHQQVIASRKDAEAARAELAALRDRLAEIDRLKAVVADLQLGIQKLLMCSLPSDVSGSRMVEESRAAYHRSLSLSAPPLAAGATEKTPRDWAKRLTLWFRARWDWEGVTLTHEAVNERFADLQYLAGNIMSGEGLPPAEGATAGVVTGEMIDAAHTAVWSREKQGPAWGQRMADYINARLPKAAGARLLTVGELRGAMLKVRTGDPPDWSLQLARDLVEPLNALLDGKAGPKQTYEQFQESLINANIGGLSIERPDALKPETPESGEGEEGQIDALEAHAETLQMLVRRDAEIARLREQMAGLAKERNEWQSRVYVHSSDIKSLRSALAAKDAEIERLKSALEASHAAEVRWMGVYNNEAKDRNQIAAERDRLCEYVKTLRAKLDALAAQCDGLKRMLEDSLREDAVGQIPGEVERLNQHVERLTRAVKDAISRCRCDAGCEWCDSYQAALAPLPEPPKEQR